MTSTTLNYKGGFKAAFGKTFKQQLPGAIILTALSLLIAIGSAATTIMDNALNIAEAAKYSITFDALVLANGIAAVCIVFSLFLAMQMFKEIYSKRACDTFFALPIKRSEYFCAKYLFGALLNIAAILLAVAVHCVILLSASTKLIEYTLDFKALFSVLPAIIFDVLCIYSIFIFCAVLSGRRLHYFFFAAIALIAPMCVTNGIVEVINSIWGAYVSPYLLTIIHPVQSLPMLMFENFGGIEVEITAGQYLPMIIAGIVESIAFFLGGYLVFKNRKAEIAEFTPAGKVIPFVFLSFVVAAELMQTSANTGFAFFVLSAIVSAVIATIIFSGIFYKKVFTKNTLITMAVSSAVCILFVGIVTLPNYTNYVKYVPEAEEVESAELVDGSMEVMNYTTYSFYANPLPSYKFEASGSYKFTTAENIENVIELHKKIVDDATIKKGKAINSDSWGDMMDYDYEYENSYDCRIIYHLKNGKTVTRKYAVPVKMISNEMVALMRNEEVLSQFGVTSVNTDDFLYSTFNSERYDKDNDNNNKKTKELTKEQFIGFVDAYRSDLLNNTSDTEFIEYLGGYTGYYVDIYNDKYGDRYYYDTVETESLDNVQSDDCWVYVAYLNSNLSEADREYYRSLSNAELYRLSDDSAEYYDKITSDSIYIYPEYVQTYKYAQSIGLID